GQILATKKSRQFELGVKGQYSIDKLAQQWGVNWFHINRPEADNINGTYMWDGQSTHQGLEGYWQGRLGAWSLAGGAMLLDATRHHSAQDFINGKSPVNVPKYTAKLSTAYT
ncbi:TonB-dependent receptor domain-containing protein, partial [Acinetobacter baumannii]|uniref:TonB-dependent receptor domain-containing protein n=1 Tax=Acinetobacter baumannii TaxID=470 RepID=UPI001146CA0F